MSIKKRRRRIMVFFAFMLMVAILGTAVACKGQKASDEPEPIDTSVQQAMDMETLRGIYFDFAIKHRFDYVPFFEEGKAPEESPEYLFYAFAINLDNWGEDKGIMTRAYVDEVIHDHFEVGEITHKALHKGWDYDGEKYIAVPQGINEEPIYVLKSFDSFPNNGRTVYDLTMDYCVAEGYEEMQSIRAAIVADDLGALTVMETESFRFYLDETTEEPVFLSHTRADGDTFTLPETPGVRYYTYFADHARQINPLFVFPGDDESITDDFLMIFAIQNLPNFDTKNGCDKQEIDRILEKYFGRTVKNYRTSVSEVLLTGKVRPKGFSFHGANRLVLQRLVPEKDGSFSGTFDVYHIPELTENIAQIDEALKLGNTEEYQEYFAESVTIKFSEIPDDDEPQGFFIRFQSIKPDKPEDWSLGTYDGPVYVIVDGSFVGSCVNGTWQSLVDPKDPYELAKYYRYLIKDIVGRGYNTYAHDREIGFASEVVLYTGVGLGGFEDGDKTELFRPFAKSVSDGVCVLPLPVQLTGSEFDTLEVPTYGYYLKIGTKISENSSTPALATNAQIIPPDGMVWSDSITGDDLASLEKVLAENGISYENPAITAATGDFDSDDKQETVFFASPQRRSDGYLDISAQNGGLFSVGMLRDDNGTYQKVYTRFLDYTDDVTAHFRVIPLGIFDLNSDGMFEICLKAGEWEGGHTFVLAQNGEGVWETVLRANWGM